MNAHNSSRSGFSLMELLAVVTILGVLAAIIVPRITVTASTANARVDEQNRALINSAVERYHLAEGDWPADDLSDIETNLNYFPLGLPTNPTTGASYTLDPSTHRVSGS